MPGILVIAEHLQGEVARITKEIVGAANAVKEGLGGPIRVAVLTDSPETLAGQMNLAGVDEIIRVNTGTAHFDASIHEDAILQLGREFKPSLIMLGHTANGLACAASVAAKVGAGYASDVIAIGVEGGELVATRSAHGGKVNTELGFPAKEAVVLTLRGATFPAASEGGSATVLDLNFVPDGGAARISHVAYVAPPSGGTDISKAEIILSVGRGIQDPANIARFAAIADTLGITLGCSRPFADAGHLPKAHQVGQSGTVASSCKIYVAVGISGAVQHLFGMKHVDTIIAVNTDAAAPIFGFAKYGSTVDALELASALEARLGLAQG